MFIDVLTELCSQASISAYKLSEKIGLNRSAVAKWKKGATPNGTTLNKIADYFGVSVDYLLGNGQKEKAPSQNEKKPDDITFDDFTYAMHNESKELTEDDKQILLDMARTLKQRRKKNNIER